MKKTKKYQQTSMEVSLIKDLDDDIYFEKRSSVSNMILSKEIFAK